MAASSDSPKPPAKERRAWVRYPSETMASIQTGHGSDSIGLAARVRTISLGGIDLLVDRPIEQGTLVSVELPGLGDRPVVLLACVVHVTSQAANQWVLGCTFSHELRDEDLRTLGAYRERAPVADQRSWVRVPCQTRASFQLVNGVQRQPQLAQVTNISPSGIHLIVREPAQPGNLLNVQLENSQGKGSLVILACVVHVSTTEKGQWALGCTFIRELEDKEFDALR
jgi:hypothetical protein